MSESSKLPPWARNRLVLGVFQAASQLDGEARIVGGAVRNWLAGLPISDIDMAINLPIGKLVDHLRATTHLKVLETGLSHGTITVIDGAQRVELTQTRDDIKTDGRHAVVRYQSDWVKDALRRDFTINAIYLDANGNFFDPLNGCSDLACKRLRFVGKAVDRVQEDALRMLRFCRFFPLFGGGRRDKDAVNALCNQASLARQLSGERIQNELCKIFLNNDSHLAVEIIVESMLDQVIFGCRFHNERLPSDKKNLAMLVKDYGWLAALGVLLPESAIPTAIKRLRLSRSAQMFLNQLSAHSAIKHYTALASQTWQRTAFFLGNDAALIYAYGAWRHDKLFKPAHYQNLLQWKTPVFPLNGTDLLSHGVDNGLVVGQLLIKAKDIWVLSDFTLSKAKLLEAVINS